MSEGRHGHVNHSVISIVWLELTANITFGWVCIALIDGLRGLSILLVTERPNQLPFTRMLGMKDVQNISGYKYEDSGLNESHSYLLPAVLKIVDAHKNSLSGRRLFDLGCGNGSVSSALAARGYDVIGVDVSVEGIDHANKRYPEIRLEIGSAYENLVEKYGKHSILVSLEVVEHLYDPRRFARTAYDLLEDGGLAIISTPYHGYLKNLALAVTNRMDRHFTALWDHGHVKFWSIKTFKFLLEEAGFKNIKFLRIGRVPALGKSMIAIARR